MGFLIFKSNQSPQEFETTNQDISFDSFRSEQRSINKTLQSYKFREKGNFKYEFNFLSETNYRSLVYLIKNRNSLREGLFILPIPYNEYRNYCILTHAESTSTNFYKITELSKPWEMPLGSLTYTPFDSGDYTKVATYDSNYFNHVAEAGKYKAIIFDFKLTDFINTFSYKELRRLTLIINGMNSSPIKFFIYDFAHASWYNIDDRFYYDDTAFDLPSGSGAFSLHKQLVGSLNLPWGNNSIYDDFMIANICRFMIAAENINQGLMVQYLRLLVNGYFVDCNDKQGVENFSVAFTGAGRSGNLEFIEV